MCIRDRFKGDFIKGTLKKLEKPIEVEGVAGNISVKYKGVMKLEVITNSGQVKSLNHTADYVPELENCRIISPQSLLNQTDREGKFVVSYNGCEFKFRDKSVVSVPIQRDTRCPVMFGFNEINTAAKALSLIHI